MEEGLITTKELCEWLRISKATVSNWRKQGLPYYGKDRSLRYKKSEIMEWLDKQEQRKK
jgi:excisionase family DNA binding protein